MQIEHDITCGPNDVFEISSNNDPDPPNDDDEVIEPLDYTGDYDAETDNHVEG